MREVLIYGNRKQDGMTWDISTPELKAKAFLELFEYLRDDWQVYTCGYWGDGKQAVAQKALYKAANKGDAGAAEKLLTMRKTYEYEEFHISHVR